MDPAGTAAPAAPGVVQPDPSGQGDAAGGAPYAEYLDRIPQEHHEIVEPVFRDWDANVTRRFQDQAQLRDQWAPYGEAGLDQFEPAELRKLADFAVSMSSDPEAYQQWLMDAAADAGLIDATLPLTGDPADGGDSAIEQVLAQHLVPLQGQLQQLTAWQEQQQLAALQQEVSGEIATVVAELQAQHGEFNTETVERFADRYIGQLPPVDCVRKGFEDYQQFVAQVEQNVFGRKLDQPTAPQVAGGPAGGAEPPQTMAEARQQAEARLRAANAS